MRRVSCKDITPEIDCNFEATGENTKDVVSKMMTHIKEEHADEVKGMSDSELRMMIEKNVHD
jgi:predicted small metal-binding protein